jgi:hypothetical protein
MIFISVERRGYRVFFARSFHTPFGEIMKKSAALITSAFLTFGLAAGAMAADAPGTTPATTPTAAPAADAAKPKKHHALRHHHHHKKKNNAAAAAAPAETMTTPK